ncbi:glycosyltransferase family 4 protein [Paucibacter sp. TC2R-5]|uniref:glycosyltransferase family 4 protein n=1 Tax=Paucibacter sp. TC2R-5 TaxID=2893555 RepID=UPI0021E43518|nr:glycosyltransferase family 4 protein [Paucibacter sp. TC2R-5]MCV2361778.1 glycosyltransferase family 4 protein [Paucibacter sp. TC2R-5]
MDTTKFRVDPEELLNSRQKFGLTENDLVLIVVARLDPEKDVELAIRTALSMDDADIVLLVVGDGKERSRLEKLVNDQPSRTRIIFLGLLKDTRSAYAVSDFLLQTSRAPNLGTVVLEAMACCTPVVIAYRDEDEYRMAIDTFDGLDLGPISEAKPEAIAAAILDLYADQSRYQALRHKVRSFIEKRHSRALVYPGLAQAYASLENNNWKRQE